MHDRKVISLSGSDPKKNMAGFDLLIRRDPPKTADELEQRARAYFESGAPLSVNGLAVACGIKNHKRLWEWGRKEVFADVIEWAKGVLMAKLEADGAEDKSRMVMRIYQLKAMGMADRGPGEDRTDTGNGDLADVYGHIQKS